MNKKKRLRKLLLLRDEIIDKVNDCNSKKALIEQDIFNLYDSLEIDNIEHGNKVYRKQINKYVNWNVGCLHEYLKKKFGKKMVDSIIIPVVTTTYAVDEEGVHQNITNGKLKPKNLKKYIEFKESKPFIRIYGADKKN